MARPSKFDGDTTIKRVDQYVDTCEANHVVPYVEELIGILGIEEKTHAWWMGKYISYYKAVKRLYRVQKVLLMRYSMTKQAAAGSIFQLKVNHGMIETNRTEIDVNHQLNRLSDEELEAELKKQAKRLGLNKGDN